MSDMNANPEIYDTKANLAIKGKYRIIQLLRNRNFNDTQFITNIGILTPTWITNQNICQRLDQIWISDNLLQNLIVTKVEPKGLLRTDHNLIYTTIESSTIVGNRTKAYEKKKKMTRKIYKIDEMLPQNWVYFREVLNDKLTASNLNNEFTSEYKDQRWINRVWNTIEKIIKVSMNETIPTKKVVKSDKCNRPKLMTDTTKANKLLMRISVATRKN